MTLYLQGSLTEDGQHIMCPLSSSVILFVIRYSQTNQFELVFVPDSTGSIDMCCSFKRNMFSDLSVRFTPWSEVPSMVRNVCLPSLDQPELSLVRSGLCVLLRHIIRESHNSSPHLHLIDLLGFRQGSMRMCSEVSGFTKLCEVELPESVSQFISTLRILYSQNQDGGKSSAPKEVCLPSALTKLDEHFRKQCRVHNDNKRRREELVKIKNYFKKHISASKITNSSNNHVNNATEKDEIFIENIKHQNSQKLPMLRNSGSETVQHSTHVCPNDMSFEVKLDRMSATDVHVQIDHVTHLNHGIRRLKVDKYLDVSATRSKGNKKADGKTAQDMGNIELSTVVKLTSCVQGSDGNPAVNGSTLPDISDLVGRLTYLDIQYEHTYSEGVEMTLADLILYVYTYHLLEALHFRSALLVSHIPSILHWADHMTSLATVVNTGQRSGWDMDKLAVGLGAGSTMDVESSAGLCRSTDVVFVKEVEVLQDSDEDEMELSRCARMKHKALKPEVAQALQKCQEASIRQVTGSHPCGDHVSLSWDQLPAGVHPREGDVPQSRTDRKCQQLENLVTAVQAIYIPGSVLVDFCSGGGHLGIILAYLLPDCQVYLVENKEESLLKASSRLESLALTNVTMYQCNLDYFIGAFDVGVCLHACGSATDMVLQLCLQRQASFVICPCCYGSIQKTHLLSYPQSKQFIEAGITYKDFLTLGHAADQTEFNIVLEGQGRLCMNLVDTDRAERACQLGYQVSLCQLKPQTCSPKNNLLLGTTATPRIKK